MDLSACRSSCTRYRIAPVYYVIGRFRGAGRRQRRPYLQRRFRGDGRRRGGVRCPGYSRAGLSPAAAYSRGDRPADRAHRYQPLPCRPYLRPAGVQGACGRSTGVGAAPGARLRRRDTAASQGEDAQRRLAQRREALFPWVDERYLHCTAGPDLRRRRLSRSAASRSS